MDIAWDEALLACGLSAPDKDDAYKESMWAIIMTAYDPRKPWTAIDRDQRTFFAALTKNSACATSQSITEAK